MLKRTEHSPGNLIAVALAGSWRDAPPSLEIDAEQLNSVIPLMLGSGTGGLGWWKIRDSELQALPAASQLQRAYRFYSIQSAFHELEVTQAFTLLRSSGIEPVLVKGWNVARLYPKPGLRFYSDVDLCVKPHQYLAAKKILDTPEGKRCNVDLHRGFENLDDGSVDEMYSRSQLIKLDDVDVRVLSLEDHLRVLCVHLLRHGAWRPLWLCDIALAVESRPAGFDWDLCLARSRLYENWIACTIGLAHQLLGARIDDIPFAAKAKRLPRWLAPRILRNWDAPFPQLFAPMSYSRPMATYLRNPSGLLEAIRARWPDPIEATIRMKGPLNEFPRLPYQIGNVVARAAKFLTSLPKSLGENTRKQKAKMTRRRGDTETRRHGEKSG